jgi:hypothetical protein
MKNFSQKSLFTKSGLYGCLAFFSFGLMSVLPAVSQTGLGVFVPENKPREAVTAEQMDKNTDERCRIQADVMLFFALRERKDDIPQTAAECGGKPQVLTATEKASGQSDETLKSVIQEMTAGYPIEKMAPAIAKYERGVAALIVGIAKKESDWGKRIPRDASGADCFNYWGYKGAGSRGVAMGHACFGSPEEAVATVGDRLTKLVALRQTSAPENMIVWKCGTSCKGHSAESVKKWIADVSLYYDRIAIRPVSSLRQ